MSFFDKLKWNIQRMSFSNRGIWRWIHHLIDNFTDISKTLNDR